ncbi:hypothetical protein CGCF415_v007939 [Colletotrichum fructicola]|nr:hypothetical protein CGCFRS4_v010358 [Colletotrichum fructicola]KAF4906539.1 hypothetical protein CGCF415_v007939 [Colletotrichum fructicola]KAF4934470.1 hypothetical protein CGCF245_v008553 [Colletotrichum fructicola]
MGETDEINFSASKERLLPSSLSRHEDENVEQIRKPRPRKYFWALLPKAATSHQSSSAKSVIALYSPANDAVEYQLTKFASSVEGGETDFQGRPSIKTNQAWQGLYEDMFTHIMEEEGRMLPNKTAHELESKESGYLVVLNCTGDVVPNVFQYSPKYGDVRARSTVVHECRNFGKIQEWAAQHHVPGPFKDFGKGPELGKCGIDDPWTCLFE